MSEPDLGGGGWSAIQFQYLVAPLLCLTVFLVSGEPDGRPQFFVRSECTAGCWSSTNQFYINQTRHTSLPIRLYFTSQDSAVLSVN